MDDDDDEECYDRESVASSSQQSYAVYSNVSTSDVAFKITHLYKKLAHDRDITTRDHLLASETLLEVQQGLATGQSFSKQSQMLLMCVISSLARRVVRMEECAFFAEDEAKRVAMNTQREDFIRTSIFVFITIATADFVARKCALIDDGAAQAELDMCMQRSLWSELCKPPSRKRALEPTTTESVDGVAIDPVIFERSNLEHLVGRPILSDEKSNSWAAVLHQPGNVAGAALRLASCLLRDAVNEDAFRPLMLTFAKHSSLQMHVQMLNSSLNDRDFLTLSARRFAALESKEIEASLSTVVGAAESEAGQVILRDLVLSFLLPRSIVGYRRTLSLSREASTAASASYPLITEVAHQTAMQGPELIWKNSDSELKRMCALLSGIAVLTTKGTEDITRKSTAFGGLVQLPFLETIPPHPRQPRLALVPTTRSWVLYTVSEKGVPVVELSKKGFDGLLYAALAFREKTAP
jgi:hypothetical protein